MRKLMPQRTKLPRLDNLTTCTKMNCFNGTPLFTNFICFRANLSLVLKVYVIGPRLLVKISFMLLHKVIGFITNSLNQSAWVIQPKKRPTFRDWQIFGKSKYFMSKKLILFVRRVYCQFQVVMGIQLRNDMSVCMLMKSPTQTIKDLS